MDLYQILCSRLLEESSKYTDTSLIKTDVGKHKCKVDNCFRNVYASGFCNAHYIRFRKDRNLNIPIRNRKKGNTCRICGIETNSKGGWGLCRRHYKSLRTKIIKDTIVEYLGGKCISCGNVYPSECYDLHHKDPSTKDYTIGSIMQIISIDKLCNEVLKCELLCSNCHRINHHSNDIS
jgi:hypothetical protein